MKSSSEQAIRTQTPLDEVVVEDPLVELMEDVGCDTGKDVGEGQVFPKRFVDFMQTFHIELLRLFVYLPLPQGLQHVNHTAVGAFLELSMIFRFNQTARALALFVATHQTLLWKFSNVGSQDQMDSAHATIGTNHGLPSMTSIDQRMQQQQHRIVEQAMSCDGSGFLLEALQLGHW